MTSGRDPALLEWLSAPVNPPIRYLTAHDLIEPRPPTDTLKSLREAILAWGPLQRILTLQLEDGSFPKGQKTPTAQPTFWALCLMHRCGLDVTDEPVARIVDYLTQNHLGKGALSYTTGGSGVLPCYLGVMAAALIKMGALDTNIVQSSIQWLVDHQRFDHKATRAGGDKTWPYEAPKNYGCWDTVSCYHGVAGAFRAFAAIPPTRRSTDVQQRLGEAVEYLRIHRLYKKSAADRPLFRHMTQFFLVGDYRSDLLDMLEGVADADPDLIHQDWVQTAVTDMGNLTTNGRVTLAKNYGKKLIDPIPFEPIGAPSRFLTYQWLGIHNTFNSALKTPSPPPPSRTRHRPEPTRPKTNHLTQRGFDMGGWVVPRQQPLTNVPVAASVCPMDTWDTITSRRQVRSFTSDSVPMEELERILEAGRRAPSARNGQRWDFVVATDEDQMERLSQVWQGAGWTAGAAATIALVMPDAEGPEALIDQFDLGQAAMQMMIAATGFGIASGQAACSDQALAQEVLGLPDGKLCLLLIAVGYAADRPLKPIQKPSRRQFDDVVHFGTW